MSDVILPVKNSSANNVHVQFTKLSAVLCLGLALHAEAAVLTWTGNAAGGNGNWNAGNNWDTLSVPQNNDSLVFPATVGGLITNNLSGRTFAQITFNSVGGSYFVFGNAITLTAGIVQSSSGGANTWHPDITLATNNQTFSVTGSGAGSALTIDGDINLNGHNLTVNVTDSGTELTLSGVVSGTGNITRSGGVGGLRFSGSSANTYSGTTTINSGYIFAIKLNNVISLPGDVVVGNGGGVDTLLMGADNQFAATSDVTIHDGGVFDINNETNTIAGLNFIDGGTVDMTTGRLQLGGTVTVTGTGVSNCIINGNLHLGSATRTFNIADTAQANDLVIDAVISGGSSGGIPSFPAGLIKSGAGVMRFNGANTYGGPTTVNDGQLTIANDKGLGGTFTLFGSAATVVNSNAVLLLNDAHVTNEVLTLNSSNPNGALQNNATADWTGPITLGTDVVIEASSAFGIDGLISGAGGFTKVGANILTLRGTNSNTYAGTTIVNNGTLQLDKAIGDAIPGAMIIGDDIGNTNSAVVRLLQATQFATDDVTIHTDGLLDLNNFSETVNNLNLAGGDAISGTNGTAASLSVNGVINVLTAYPLDTTSRIGGRLNVGSGTQFISFPVGSLAIGAPELQVDAHVAGSALISVTGGSGDLFLNSSNSFTGPFTVGSGNRLLVHIGNDFALGDDSGGTSNTGSSGFFFELAANNTSEPFTLCGDGPVGNGGVISLTGGMTLNSNVVLACDSTINCPAGTALTINGAISGSANLTKEGTGTLTIGGASANANTYTGTTTVNAGTLQLNKSGFDGAIPGSLGIRGTVRLLSDNQISNDSDVTVTSTGLLALNGFFEGVDTISGDGSIDLGSQFIHIGYNNGSSTFSGVISGAGDLAKQSGTGTLTLTGNNTYTGLTEALAGTLLINGSQPQSPVSIGSAGTLGGTGTVGNIATASGNLSPGASPGMLTSSNVVFTASGDYFVELTGPAAGSDYDQLNVRGTNVLANAVLHVTAAFTTPVGVGQQFTILNNDASEAINGTFSGLAEGATISTGGYKFTISYVGGSGNDVVLTLTNVPSTTVASIITSGNGNHTIDPNECNNLSLVISNQSGSLMSGITATLSTTTPGVIITQPYSDYPNIAANGKGTNSTPFQISTLSGFVCGTDIQLQLTVNSSAGAFVIDSVLKTGSGLPSATPIRYDVAGPVAIPDPGILNSVAAVAGFAGPLTKVGVSLWLTHPVDGDLNIGLVSPDGVIVDLSSGNGAAGDDYGTACSPEGARTTFDDGAGLSILAGAPPYVGTFKPESPLSAVLGGTINGNWTLRINDTVAGGAGSLRCWSLFLYPMACSTGGGACDNCLPPITGAINNSDSVESNRVFRTFTAPSSCGAPRPFPGISTASIHYDLYTFTNTSAADACVSVQLGSACDVQAVAYLNSFNPADPGTNYLGDSASSTLSLGGPVTFSCTVPAGARFLVVVNEINSGAGCPNYTLQLSGLPCPPPILYIDPLIPAPSVRLHWSTSAGGYKLEGTPTLSPASWVTVPNEPIVTGSEYRVTNSAPPVNRFYRLNKP